MTIGAAGRGAEFHTNCLENMHKVIREGTNRLNNNPFNLVDWGLMQFSVNILTVNQFSDPLSAVIWLIRINLIRVLEFTLLNSSTRLKVSLHNLK